MRRGLEGLRSVTDRLGDPSLVTRVWTTLTALLMVFVVVTLLSNLLLPEGLLRGRAPGQAWQGATDPFRLAAQILAYNLISVFVIFVGSLFARRGEGRSHFFSVGYLVLFTLATLNAVVLGTWSFSDAGSPVPLGHRLVGMLDLAHRAGVWEMVGQALLACALARSSLVRTQGGDTTVRPVSALRLSRTEAWVLASGFVSMVVGALVEGFAITTR